MFTAAASGDDISAYAMCQRSSSARQHDLAAEIQPRLPTVLHHPRLRVQRIHNTDTVSVFIKHLITVVISCCITVVVDDDRIIIHHHFVVITQVNRWSSYLEHFAIDPTCIDHYTRTVSERTKDNTVSFGLRGMTRRCRDCLGH